MADRSHWPRAAIVTMLGTSQTLAWGSSYYLLAILADPIAQELGMSTTRIFAALSASLLISALVGPHVGRSIDRFGGREVLAGSNLLFAAGLALLALTQSEWQFWLVWLIMGLGMGLGLYDAAFATLGRIYGEAARRPITGITLFGGFASTVAWPLTAWGEAEIGWRYTCLAWGFAHLALGLPLNLLLPGFRTKAALAAPAPKSHIPMDRTMWLLGFATASGWIVASAMGAHMPRILEAAGATTAEAVAAAAMFGPGQVAARIFEATLFSRYHPLVSARLSMVTHPLGVGLLLTGGAWLAVPFALLHGAGNGILTIARGTVPLALYGPVNYGYRLGLLGAPARLMQAVAPLLFSVLVDRFGAHALLFSATACLAACAAFLAIRIPAGPASTT
jgi:MFS family permease